MKHLAGQYFHVFNRGVNHQAIFRSNENYLFLLHTIKRFLPQYSISFISYCLMPNHYHFLIRVNQDNQLAPFLQRLFNSYTQAFNKQHQRSGTLFESNAKYRLVETNEYVLLLSKYIHLNPVKAGLVSRPEQWLFSNFQEWADLRNGTLHDQVFEREFFSTPGDYIKFVEQFEPEANKKIKDYLFE